MTGVATDSRARAIEEIRTGEHFLLVTHENPDGDALGSLVGMHGVLTALAMPTAQGSMTSWLAIGIGSFVVGWVFQFVDHYYEGKKPAFVDDLVGLLVGPMFVVGEAMFMLGWGRPLLAEIERRVGPTHLRDLAHP